MRKKLRLLKYLKKDENRIPDGMYCYKFTGEKSMVMTKDGLVSALHTKYCPYRMTKEVAGGVRLPYCNYLKMFGFPVNKNLGDRRWNRLKKRFGGKLYDVLALDLLFDGVKECGVNDDIRE